MKGPLSKRPKVGFQDQLWLNAGQKYCRMLQGDHSAILLTFIKVPFVIKIFVLPIFLRVADLHRFYCILLLHCSFFITLCLGSIGMDFAIK